MNKQAYLKSLTPVLNKQAGAWSDTFKGLPVATGVTGSLLAALSCAKDKSEALKGAAVMTTALAAMGITRSVAGAESQMPYPAESLRLSDKNNQYAWNPMNGIMANSARSSAVHTLLGKRKQRNALHEALSVINPLNLIASPTAMLLAGITSTRSLKEQAQVSRDPEYGLKSWLIPGYGTYNKYKAIGVSNQIGKNRKGYTDEDIAKTNPGGTKYLFPNTFILHHFHFGPEKKRK